MQAERPRLGPYFPASQLAHDATSAPPESGLYLPVPQLSQTLFRPDAVLYFPGVQLMQSVAAVVWPYLPGSHLVHAR